MTRLSCRRCGHSDEAPEGILEGVASCDQCGARIAFGQTIPRILIEPTSDDRFVCVMFDGVAVVLDREFGHLLGKELLSVCRAPEPKAPAVAPEDEEAKRQRIIALSSKMAAKLAEEVAAHEAQAKAEASTPT
jgi:hypothetical protein